MKGYSDAEKLQFLENWASDISVITCLTQQPRKTSFLDVVQCMIWQAEGQENWLLDGRKLHTNILQKDNGEPHSTEVFQRTLLKESSERAISSTYVRITKDRCMIINFKSMPYFSLGAWWKYSFPLKQNLVLLSWNSDIGSESSNLSANRNRSLQKQCCYFVLNVCIGSSLHKVSIDSETGTD